MKRLTRLAAVIAVLVTPALALAASRPGRVLVPNCNRAAYKPGRLILACGDGSNFVAKLAWMAWTARRATGAGVDEVNDCAPDCVKGHLHAYPANVALSRPKRCRRIKGHDVFGRIVLQFPGAHPGGSDSLTASLACPF